MKKVNWVIDKDLFPEYENILADSIKRSGNDVHFFDDFRHNNISEFMRNKFTDKDIVVFYGSLGQGRQIANLPYYPGVFLNIENYECYRYYGYYGDYLLNSDYLMMGLNDVSRHKWDILHKLVETKGNPYQDSCRFFIRPSNGYKTFTGQTITWSKMEEEIETITNSYGGTLDKNQLVLLSSVKPIECEYRFIVVDGKVITGSTYFDKNNIGSYEPYYDKQCEEQDVIDFAVKMSEIYQPDKAFSIDICRLKSGELKMLELGSFNCASMYGNDFDKIVNAINELSIKEYNELFEI